MKKHFARILSAGLALCLFPLCYRFFPDFSILWARCFARPILKILSGIGAKLPFSLLEWGSVCLLLVLLLCFMIGIFRRGLLPACAKLAQHILRTVFALTLCFCTVWLPLYFDEENPLYSADAAQLFASCRLLTAELNASVPDFSEIPDDLPAKFIAFPEWMLRLNIDGFCSFFTGEALISPALPDYAVPFVAVHEAMHCAGHAGEGAANIAAWNECMRRGGAYADSARIWALKDSLALLRQMDFSAWLCCRAEMRSELNHLLHENEGASATPAAAVQAAFAALGIGKSIQDYEMLALYLAANLPK